MNKLRDYKCNGGGKMAFLAVYKREREREREGLHKTHQSIINQCE
jgi:hypothetical protein